MGPQRRGAEAGGDYQEELREGGGMSVRVERPLSEFVDFAYGKGLPARDRKEGEFPVYGSAGVVDSHETPLIKGPGVIVGRKGTVGAVHWSDKDFFPIDTTFYVVPKGEIRLRYAYYLLKTLPLQQMNTDVAVPWVEPQQCAATQGIRSVVQPTRQDR